MRRVPAGQSASIAIDPHGARCSAAQRPGEIVSFDVLDACAMHRHGRQRNAIVFTDHYSRFKNAYLLKSKAEAQDAVDMFLKYARSKGVTVSRLHRDGAREF
jgi:hypothetical protein